MTSGARKWTSILSRIDAEELKSLKVAVKRYNITDAGPPQPLQRSLDDKAALVIHFRKGEGVRPIFDREDVLVNEVPDENLEERLVRASPSARENEPRRPQNRSYSRSGSRSSHGERSDPSFHKKRSRSRSPRTKRNAESSPPRGNRGYEDSRGYSQHKERSRTPMRPGEYRPPLRDSTQNSKYRSRSPKSKEVTSDKYKSRRSRSVSKDRFRRSDRSRSPHPYKKSAREGSRSPAKRDVDKSNNTPKRNKDFTEKPKSYNEPSTSRGCSRSREIERSYKDSTYPDRKNSERSPRSRSPPRYDKNLRLRSPRSDERYRRHYESRRSPGRYEKDRPYNHKNRSPPRREISSYKRKSSRSPERSRVRGYYEHKRSSRSPNHSRTRTYLEHRRVKSPMHRSGPPEHFRRRSRSRSPRRSRSRSPHKEDFSVPPGYLFYQGQDYFIPGPLAPHAPFQRGYAMMPFPRGIPGAPPPYVLPRMPMGMPYPPYPQEPRPRIVYNNRQIKKPQVVPTTTTSTTTSTVVQAASTTVTPEANIVTSISTDSVTITEVEQKDEEVGSASQSSQNVKNEPIVNNEEKDKSDS